MSEFIWTIACQRCGGSHKEGTEEAEFIAWNGVCAECELSGDEGTRKGDGE